MVLKKVCFTVEPMINAGKYETILSKHDGWTVTTRDKSLSAQFEHTIELLKNSFEILPHRQRIRFSSLTKFN